LLLVTAACLLLVQWRESECFLHCPYSFSRLKQLPELRQIISHTCLDAVQAAAGSMTCITAASASSTAKPLGSEAANNTQQRKPKQQRDWDALDDLDLDSDDSDDSNSSSSDLLGSESSTPAVAALRKLLVNPDSPLLLHLSPALRLCLAAEVAVGMLCPG
jgi:hypothetical protein